MSLGDRPRPAAGLTPPRASQSLQDIRGLLPVQHEKRGAQRSGGCGPPRPSASLRRSLSRENIALARRDSVEAAGRNTDICGIRLRSRTGTLCRLPLLVAIVALVLLNAASSGFMLYVAVPPGRGFASLFYDYDSDPGTGFTQLYSRVSDAAATWSRRPQNSRPNLIPRIIHQTFKTSDVPAKMHPMMNSWREQNPDHEIRFYDDKACQEFVAREFPEYLAAYNGLPKDVERADFFRYMVILRLGGVYADIDTECRWPLESFLSPRDTLVVGWENEFPSYAAAARHHYVRRRQVLQWTFMGAPGHPALREVCEHIMANYKTTFSSNPNVDTLERTGPGVWTDIALKHSRLHPPTHKDEDPWGVRFLPRVALGVNPKQAGLDGLSPDLANVLVLHHFLGSWKAKGAWKSRGLGRLVRDARDKALAPFFGGGGKLSSEKEGVRPDDEAEREMYPVSAAWHPPFDVMVHLVGVDADSLGNDVSGTLSNWGMWQPGPPDHPDRRPRVVDALVGSLGAARGALLVDVGAGLGFFSLAAAARGHRVVALEYRPDQLRLLAASVEANGFEGLVEVHQVAPGANETRCRAGLGDVSLDVGESGVDVAAALEAMGAAVVGASACVPRARLDDVLMAGAGSGGMGGGGGGGGVGGAAGGRQLPSVSALRLAAGGHEGWALEGAAALMSSSAPPRLVYLEFQPHRVRAAGFDPGRLLERMVGWGYTNVSHSGPVCDARWRNITALALRRDRQQPDWRALQQPTWCRVTQAQLLPVLLGAAHPSMPENLMFIHSSSVTRAWASGEAREKETERGSEKEEEGGGGAVAGVLARAGGGVEPGLRGGAGDGSGGGAVAVESAPLKPGLRGKGAAGGEGNLGALGGASEPPEQVA